MLKVLFVAAEAVPFVKTGGLADVVGSLPQELRSQGIDARVVIPKYKTIPDEFKEQLQHITNLETPLAWRQQYCGISQCTYHDVPVYFIDNEYYFKRQSLYGYYDDAERYAFFSRSVLEMLPHIDFIPDIIHCHDWHTGLVAVFLDAFYRSNSVYQNIRTIFTVHNLGYQGIFDKAILTDILDLGWNRFTSDKLEFNDCVNFLKAGIVYSDIITTVSKTYAEEIKQPYYGEQLDGLLRARAQSLVGILNGLDYSLYNPLTDCQICPNYDADSHHNKKENKTRLQSRLGLPVKRNVPMIAIVSRLVASKGLDLIARVLDELVAHENIQLAVLGTGEARYEEMFRAASWRYPAKISANIFFDDSLARQIYAGSDLFLMPSQYEPCGIGQLIALRYGSLPVVRETGGLKDTVNSYNKYTGEGNGFSFTNYNAHDMLFTVKRALGLYNDKPVWNTIVRNAMTADFSWRQSAQEYIEAYKRVTGK